MDSWTTLDSEIAYTCDGFDVVNETVELPTGERSEFDYVVEGDSVVILPFRPDGRVVVIDEWRHAVGRVNHGLPAGSVEPGEDLNEAVVRELAEETGYEPGAVERLTSLEPVNGFSDAVFHYYVAFDCEQQTGQSLDRDETIEVSTTTFESLLEAVREGDLQDGRTALAILYYQLFEAGR